MGTLTLADEVEILMRERLWLPWYERYGPDFKLEMFRYPLEQRLQPDNDHNDA
jgi:hypothetical protein